MRKLREMAGLMFFVLLNLAISASPASAIQGMDPRICTDGQNVFACCWSCNWPYEYWCYCDDGNIVAGPGDMPVDTL